MRIIDALPKLLVTFMLMAGCSEGSQTDPTGIGGPIHPDGPDLLHLGQMTLDRSGNVWIAVAGQFGGYLIEYTRAQLQDSGLVAPRTLLQLGPSTFPTALTFDQAGRLWIVTLGRFELGIPSHLLGLSPSQLSTSGAVNPVATVSLAGLNLNGTFYYAESLTLDPLGNFWISANLRTSAVDPSAQDLPSWKVTEFTADQIAAGGAPEPSVTISQPGVFPTGYGPGLTFDAEGNLWTANIGLGSLTQFAAGTLNPGANPVPAVTLTGPSLGGVRDIVADRTGGLVVANRGIFRYLRDQVTVSGSPEPADSFLPANGYPIRHLQGMLRRERPMGPPLVYTQLPPEGIVEGPWIIQSISGADELGY